MLPAALQRANNTAIPESPNQGLSVDFAPAFRLVDKAPPQKAGTGFFSSAFSELSADHSSQVRVFRAFRGPPLPTLAARLRREQQSEMTGEVLPGREDTGIAGGEKIELWTPKNIAA